MSVIGDNIHALRILNGITQQELADIAEVTRETVNKWETGAIGNVRTSNVNRLREYFDLSVDDLRSETCGLAAKLDARSGATAGDEGTEAQVPVIALSDLRNDVYTTEATRLVEVPASVRRNHPHSFAFVIDDSMSRIMPEGCHAVADPDAQPNTDAIVLASAVGNDKPPMLRRLRRGETKAMLSVESYTRHEDDIIMDVNELHVIGTVVWYQPQQELWSLPDDGIGR